MAHAQFSPSGAFRRIACPGSQAMEAPFPDTHSAWADEGTAAHLLGSTCLEDGADTAKYVGRDITVCSYGDWDGAKWGNRTGEPGFTVRGVYRVGEAMAEAVQRYVDKVREAAARIPGCEILVEQSLSIAGITGEPAGRGTSDAVLIGDTVIETHDLKYGRSPVGIVYAAENVQLVMYTLAGIDTYDIFDRFERARLVIHQPRLNHCDAWTIDRPALDAWRPVLWDAARHCRRLVAAPREEVLANLNASPDTCVFCKAKNVCPAYAQMRSAAAESAEADSERRRAAITPTDERLF